MKIKQIISMALTAVMLITAIPAHSIKAETPDSSGNAISGRQSENAGETGYSIKDVEIKDKTAYISLTAPRFCSAVVGIYDADGKKLLGTGVSGVSSPTGVTKRLMTIDIDEMPEYYYIRAYLVDSRGLNPLCEVYEDDGNANEDHGVIARGTFGKNVYWKLSGGILRFWGTGDMLNVGTQQTTTITPWYKYSKSITEVVVEEGVTSVGPYAFQNLVNLKKVTLSESVTYIGDLAFKYCENLTSFKMGDSVTYIGEQAFDDVPVIEEQKGLKYINNWLIKCDYYEEDAADKRAVIKDGTVGIARSAFRSNGYIESITIPDSVAYIGECAFYGCGSITSIVIPEKVTEIKDHTFYSCRSLENIKLGNNITSIGQYAFVYCRSLKSITMPHSLTEINRGAFGDCSSLESIILPKSLKSIYDNYSTIFSNCGKLKDIYYEGTEEQWNEIYISDRYIQYITVHYSSTQAAEAYGRTQSGTDTAYLDSEPVLTAAEGGTASAGKTVEFTGLNPNTIYNFYSMVSKSSAVPLSSVNLLYINQYVSDGNGKLTVTYEPKTECGFPDEFVAGIIDGNACGDNLTWEFDEETGKVTISGTGQMWHYNNGSSPFSALGNKIKSVTIENGATTVGALAFKNCTELSSVSLPESLDIIYEEAFSGCGKLNKIKLPDALIKIGKNAFLDSGMWTSRKWSMSDRDIVKYADNWVIGYDYNTADISESEKSCMTADTNYVKTIREGTKGIADFAFYGAKSYSFALPDSLEFIGESAFENCPNLISITIPKNVKSIKKRALYSTNLRSVTFETTTCSIYDSDDTIYIGADLWTVNDSQSITDYYNRYKSLNEYRNNFNMNVGSGRYFKPERDGNSFRHQNGIGDGFEGLREYKFISDYSKKYYSCAKKYINTDLLKKLTNKANNDLNKRWQGSCFGIAATMTMSYNKNIDISKALRENYPNYYMAGRPCENYNFIDMITYYYISQNAAASSTSKATLSYVYKSWGAMDHMYEKQGDLTATLAEIVNKTLNSDKAYMLSVKGKDLEHSLVISNGFEKDDYYVIRVYDMNSSIIGYMAVKNDHSSFVLNCGHISLNEKNFKYLALTDTKKLYDSFPLPDDLLQPIVTTDSKKFYLMYDPMSKFSLENSSGEKLIYSPDKAEGDMTVYNVRSISFDDEDEGGSYSYDVIEIDRSEKFILTCGSDDVYADIYDGSSAFISVEGKGIKSAEFDFKDNTVKTSGDNYSFEAYIATRSEVAENEEGLVSISGNTTGEVNISAENGKVRMTSANKVNNTKVKSYVEMESKEYEIADKTGFTINVDSKGEVQEADNTTVTTTPAVTTTTAATTAATTTAAPATSAAVTTTAAPTTSAAVTTTAAPTTSAAVTTTAAPATSAAITTTAAPATSAAVTTAALVTSAAITTVTVPVTSTAATAPVTSTAAAAPITSAAITTVTVPVTSTAATTAAAPATSAAITTVTVPVTSVSATAAITTLPVTTVTTTAVITTLPATTTTTTAVITTLPAAATTATAVITTLPAATTTTTAIITTLPVTTATTTAVTTTLPVTTTATTTAVTASTAVSTTTAAVTTVISGEDTDISNWEYKELDDGTIAITGYKDDTAEKLTIPQTIDGKKVTKIDDDAFYSFEALKEVIIPDGVKEIGIFAFGSCTALKKVNIPDSVTAIDDLAFCHCGLEEAVLPEGVKYMGRCVFMFCLDLKKAELPDSITEMAGGLFADCYYLEEVKLPENTEYLYGAHIELDDGETAYYGFFDNCENLKSVVLPESLTFITGETFYMCESLKSLTVLNRHDINVEDATETIPVKTDIYGYSYAGIQYYALAHGNRYYLLDADNALSGDVSGNGKIDLYDAIAVAEYMLGSRRFTDREILIADYDGDGKAGLYDAIKIAGYMVSGRH